MNIEQAEVMTDHYATPPSDRFATKEDISLLRKDMDQFWQGVDGKLEMMGKELWIKMLISQLGIGGLIIAVLSYLG